MPTARTRSPKVKMHSNGHVTISGLNYRDARSLLTSAQLYRDEHPVADERGLEAKEWERRQLWINRALRDGIKEAIENTHPQRPVAVGDRWKAVQEKRSLREMFKRIFARRVIEE